MDRNLKYVDSEPKIYRSKIIFKINLKGGIVLSAPYISDNVNAKLSRSTPSRWNRHFSLVAAAPSIFLPTCAPLPPYYTTTRRQDANLPWSPPVSISTSAMHPSEPRQRVGLTHMESGPLDADTDEPMQMVRVEPLQASSGEPCCHDRRPSPRRPVYANSSGIQALFTCGIFFDLATVALLFVCDKYCLIID